MKKHGDGWNITIPSEVFLLLAVIVGTVCATAAFIVDTVWGQHDTRVEVKP